MDLEYGFSKKISVEWGFSVATMLPKMEFKQIIMVVSGLFFPQDIAFYVAFTG